MARTDSVLTALRPTLFSVEIRNHHAQRYLRFHIGGRVIAVRRSDSEVDESLAYQLAERPVFLHLGGQAGADGRVEAILLAESAKMYTRATLLVRDLYSLEDLFVTDRLIYPLGSLCLLPSQRRFPHDLPAELQAWFSSWQAGPFSESNARCADALLRTL